MEIRTIKETRSAIKSANVILMQPRFGLSERWIKISKKEALDYLSDIPNDATPEDLELGDMFAELKNDGELYIG